MSEESKALIRRLYDEGINRHDARAAAAFYTVDAKNHLRDGEISEHAAVRDDMGMMLQLGLAQRPD